MAAGSNTIYDYMIAISHFAAIEDSGISAVCGSNSSDNQVAVNRVENTFIPFGITPIDNAVEPKHAAVT
mgnify:CR=1 FL=1